MLWAICMMILGARHISLYIKFSPNNLKRKPYPTSIEIRFLSSVRERKQTTLLYSSDSLISKILLPAPASCSLVKVLSHSLCLKTEILTEEYQLRCVSFVADLITRDSLYPGSFQWSLIQTVWHNTYSICGVFFWRNIHTIKFSYIELVQS